MCLSTNLASNASLRRTASKAGWGSDCLQVSARKAWLRKKGKQMGVGGAACTCRSCPITVWTGAQGQAGLLKTFREVFAMRWYKLTPPLGSTGFSKSSFVCVNCCSRCKKHDRYSLKQKEQNFLAIFPSFYSKLKGSSAVSWGIRSA